VHSDASVASNVDALFFMFGWDWYGYDKKHAGIHYAELVCLPPVGFVGDIVQTNASGV
jgi:hypothetical protein